MLLPLQLLNLLEPASGGLFAEDIESASEVGSPSIGQVHGLLAQDVESASEVTSPSAGQDHALLANDIESSSEVSNPGVDSNEIIQTLSLTGRFDVEASITGRFDNDTKIMSKVA